MQLGLDGVVVVRLDDGRGEEGVAVGRHDQSQVHEPTQPDAVILHDCDRVAECDLALGPIIALLSLQARLNIGLFLLC